MGSCRQKSLPPPPCIFLTVHNSSGASSYGKKTNMGDAHLRQASNNIRRRSNLLPALKHAAMCPRLAETPGTRRRNHQRETVVCLVVLESEIQDRIGMQAKVTLRFPRCTAASQLCTRINGPSMATLATLSQNQPGCTIFFLRPSPSSAICYILHLKCNMKFFYFLQENVYFLDHSSFSHILHSN